MRLGVLIFSIICVMFSVDDVVAQYQFMEAISSSICTSSSNPEISVLFPNYHCPECFVFIGGALGIIVSMINPLRTKSRDLWVYVAIPVLR